MLNLKISVVGNGMKEANQRFIKIEIIEIIQFNLCNFLGKLNYEEVVVVD